MNRVEEHMLEIATAMYEEGELSADKYYEIVKTIEENESGS